MLRIKDSEPTSNSTFLVQMNCKFIKLTSLAKIKDLRSTFSKQMTTTVNQKRFQQAIDFTICKTNLKSEIKKVMRRAFPGTESSSNDTHSLDFNSKHKRKSANFPSGQD